MTLPLAALKRTGVVVLAATTILGIGFGSLAVASIFRPSSSDCDQMAAEADDRPDAAHTAITVGLSGNTDATISETKSAIRTVITEAEPPATVAVVSVTIMRGDRPIETQGCIGRPVAIGASSALLKTYEDADDLRKGLLEGDMATQREDRVEILLASVDDAIRNPGEPDVEPTAFGIWAAAASRLSADDTAVIIDAFSPGGDNCMTLVEPSDLRDETVIADRVEQCIATGQLPVVAAADIELVALTGTLNVTQTSAQSFVMAALCSRATDSPCTTSN
jgi:hypothetical protein